MKSANEKTWSTTTAPQSSSLSPALWRIFDGIFSTIYTNQLQELRRNCKTVHDFHHVSYAEDHVTILVLKLKKNLDSQRIGAVISKITSAVRDLLNDATTAAGCSINTEKSELIVPPGLAGIIPGAKTEYVWLGYSLKLTKDIRLLFTETKIIARLKKSKLMVRTIFQYI